MVLGSQSRSSVGKCRTTTKESQRSTIKIYVPNDGKGKQSFKVFNTPSVSSIGKFKFYGINLALLVFANSYLQKRNALTQKEAVKKTKTVVKSL